jgi:isopropylmalate/homocitrate/citramalate synthase
MNFPNSVTLIEVGLRDGFQFETKVAPTELKLEIISELVQAGLKHIQVVSFVNPKRVPQMADAEELLRRLPKQDGVIYSGLVLNTKGLERAYLAGLETGIWESESDIEKLPRESDCFKPGMSEDKRSSLYKGWRATVNKAFADLIE